jgi:hypothetical protein
MKPCFKKRKKYKKENLDITIKTPKHDFWALPLTASPLFAL